jgi:hypothetical protein
MRRFRKKGGGEKKVKQLVKEADILAARIAFGTAVINLISPIGTARAKGLQDFGPALKVLMEQTKDGINFCSAELSVLTREDRLFDPAVQEEPGNHVVMQLIALNAMDALERIYSSENTDFPDIQVSFITTFMAALLESYHNHAEQQERYERLWTIFNLVRPDDGLARLHFQDQMVAPAHRAEMEKVMMRQLNPVLPEIVSDEDATAIADCYKEIYYGSMLDDDSLLSVISEIAPISGEKQPDMSSVALPLFALYENIFHCRQHNLPALKIYRDMLNLVRGGEESRAREAFNAVWAYPEFLAAFKTRFGAVFKVQIAEMIDANQSADIEFWKQILDGIPPHAIVRDMFLRELFSSTEIKMTVDQPESVGDADAQQRVEQTAYGWAAYICARQNYDWDQIRPQLGILVQVIEKGAPLGVPACRKIMQTLLAKMDENEGYDDIFLAMLGALREAGSIERNFLLGALDSKAGRLERVFGKAIATQQSHAVVSMLRRGNQASSFRDILLNPLLEIADEAAFDKICFMIGSLRSYKTELKEVVAILKAKDLFQQVILHIQSKQDGLAVYVLSRHGEINNSQTEACMYNILMACDPAVDPFESVIQDPGEDQQRSSVAAFNKAFLVMREKSRAVALAQRVEDMAEGIEYAVELQMDELHFAREGDLEKFKQAVTKGAWASVISILSTYSDKPEKAAMQEWLERNKYAESGFGDQIDAAMHNLLAEAGARGSLRRAREDSFKAKERLVQQTQADGQRAAVLPPRDPAVADHAAYKGDVSKAAAMAVLKRDLLATGGGAFALGVKDGRATVFIVTAGDCGKDIQQVDISDRNYRKTVVGLRSGKVDVFAAPAPEIEDTLESFLDYNKAVFANAMTTDIYDRAGLKDERGHRHSGSPMGMMAAPVPEDKGRALATGVATEYSSGEDEAATNTFA